MSEINSIIQSIQGIVEFSNPISVPSIMIGTVLSIDGNTCTIQPADTALNPIPGILLSSDATAAPTFVPAIGTQVCLNMFTPGSGIVSSTGAINTAAIAGNSNGGLIIGLKLVQQLNDIQNQINKILSGLQGITVAIPSGGGSVSFAPFFTESPLILTQTSDIESNFVTHGEGTVNNLTYQQSVEELQSTYDASLELYGSFVLNYNNAKTKFGVVSSQAVSTQKNVEHQATIVQQNLEKLNKVLANPQ